MARAHPLIARVGRRLEWHQAAHDPVLEPRNRLRWLPELRRWQAARLETSFAHFLADSTRRAAAMFFLTDVYGDHDFSGRDANVAKVMPMMQRLLPFSVLETVAHGIELGVLTHVLDMRMAEALQRLAPHRRKLDADLYGQAYREVGLHRLRAGRPAPRVWANCRASSSAASPPSPHWATARPSCAISNAPSGRCRAGCSRATPIRSVTDLSRTSRSAPGGFPPRSGPSSPRAGSPGSR